MIEKKHLAALAGLVLAASLAASCMTALFLAGSASRVHVRALGEICQRIIEKQPESEQAVLSALKEYKLEQNVPEKENVLVSYGYGKDDFLHAVSGHVRIYAVLGLAVANGLFVTVIFSWNKIVNGRIKALTDYLEKINMGKNGTLALSGEDEFSKLQDEIYKTVTALD